MYLQSVGDYTQQASFHTLKRSWYAMRTAPPHTVSRFDSMKHKSPHQRSYSKFKQQHLLYYINSYIFRQGELGHLHFNQSSALIHPCSAVLKTISATNNRDFLLKQPIYRSMRKSECHQTANIPLALRQSLVVFP